MLIAYASIYLLPALVLLLGIWMGIRLLAELGAGTATRRGVFVLLATLLLTPTVSGSIVAIAWIPNGLLLLSGAAPMLHQPKLVTFNIVSFSTTAAVSAIVAWLTIRSISPTQNDPGRPVRLCGLLAGIGLLLLAYYAWLPNRNIPQHVDWALMETEFGPTLDNIFSTLEIADLNAARARRNELAAMLSRDPIFWSVKFKDDRFSAESGSTFFERRMSRSHSCSGQPGNHHKLMRCDRSTDALFEVETLRFTRRVMSLDAKQYVLELELEYDTFLQRYSTPTPFSLPAHELAAQDQQLLGRWRLQRRSDIGDQGPRIETVEMTIGPRTAPGTYTVSAEANLASVDNPNQSMQCKKPQDRCKWFEQSNAVLNVRGAQVQIIYGAKGWFTDRLTLSATGLTGVDPWGYLIHFRRVPAVE
ncbi:MAG: hypothetical protein AAF529_03865 [Pseudomonadota bacterium]